MKRPGTPATIVFLIVGVTATLYAASVSSSVLIGLSAILAIPVVLLDFVVENYIVTVTIGAVLWSITALSVIMSGSPAWRRLAWLLIALVAVGAIATFIVGLILVTPRGGM